MTFDTYDVVSVPFPFTDQALSKKRPALVLSSASTFNLKAGHSVMGMITSAKNAPWPLDVRIQDLESAGLPAPSVVRMKLFTLDHRLALARLGSLAVRDRKNLIRALKALFKEI